MKREVKRVSFRSLKHGVASNFILHNDVKNTPQLVNQCVL